MDKLETLKIRLDLENDDSHDDALESFLDAAMLAILERRYPFHDFPVDDSGNLVLESRYSDLQLRIAAEMFAKMGAEGETRHDENELSRSYECAGISPSLLAMVVPKAGVL